MWNRFRYFYLWFHNFYVISLSYIHLEIMVNVILSHECALTHNFLSYYHHYFLFIYLYSLWNPISLSNSFKNPMSSPSSSLNPFEIPNLSSSSLYLVLFFSLSFFSPIPLKISFLPCNIFLWISSSLTPLLLDK